MEDKNERAKNDLPYDRGWAWMVVLGCFINNFCIMGIVGSFGMLAYEFKSYFDVSTSMATMVMAAAALVMTFCIPVGMTLGEQYGERPVVIIGGICGALGFALAYLLYSIEYLIAVFGIFFGIGSALTYGNNMAIVAKYFTKRRTLASGIGVSGAGIGQLLMSPLLQFLLDTYTIRGVCLVLSGLYLNMCVGGCLYRPFPSQENDKNKPQNVEMQQLIDDESTHGGSVRIEMHKTSNSSSGSKTSNGEIDTLLEVNRTEAKSLECKNASTNNVLPTKSKNYASQSDDGSSYLSGESDYQFQQICESQVQRQNEVPRKSARSTQHAIRPSKLDMRKFLQLFDYRSVLQNYKVLLLGLVFFFNLFGTFAFMQFLPMIAIERGVTHYDKAIIISLRGVGDTVGRLVIGFIGDLNFISRYKLLAFSSITLGGFNVLIFTYANKFWWMAIHGFFSGVISGIPVALVASVVVDFVGLDHLAKTMGVLMLTQGLAAATGQPLFGYIRDVTGDYVIVCLLIGALYILSGGTLLLYPLVERLQNRRDRKRQQKELSMKT